MAAKCPETCFLNGGDCVGMTDNQYKGMLLDQLEVWQEIFEMAIKAGNTDIQKKSRSRSRRPMKN